MTKPAVDLLRFLSGRGRLEVLDYLRRGRGPPPTINELSRQTGVPVGTTWHAVHDLENLGLVLLDRIGNSALVTPNKASPVWQRLEALLGLDLQGPHQLACDYFVRRLRSRLPDIPVYQFGSVKAGTHSPESDVDIEVVFGGSGYDRETVQRACVEASNETLDRFRITVSPLISSRKMVIAAD